MAIYRPPPTNVDGALLFSACPSVYPLSCSILVIFNGISTKFHIWMASIKLSFKFEYGFCLTNDNQDDRHNGSHLSVFSVVVTIIILIFNRSSPKFHIWIASIKLARSSSNMGFAR